MKNVLIGFLLVFITTSLSAQNGLDEVISKYNKGLVPYVSVEELKMMSMKEDILIADAREPEEFDISHLPEAEFVGYSDFSIGKFLKHHEDKTRAIVVYCSLGIRSEDIANKIRNAGYSKVYNLYGGIFEWKNKGYDVFTDGKPTDSVHTYSSNWSNWLINGEKIY
ncbi:rhodanese-like domain-containing protein [Christiangramia salexigens]|uniref:Rhodanese n=1 Tax=Christiangramia salexigens TaxID=1913577 RepID=A0A1L3J5X5_9FLAO|nr:rhodanese-like domain-containing protein [Christiangramia salexigens]APG60549.1 rhodanese [Christiangramia salexigens]